MRTVELPTDFGAANLLGRKNDVYRRHRRKLPLAVSSRSNALVVLLFSHPVL